MEYFYFIQELEDLLEGILIERLDENFTKNIGIMIGSVSLGTLGFIFTPVVGIVTTISGIVLGFGVVKIVSKN